jgi:hypothetical protein
MTHVVESKEHNVHTCPICSMKELFDILDKLREIQKRFKETEIGTQEWFELCEEFAKIEEELKVHKEFHVL